MHLALGAKSSGVFYCVDFHEDSDLNASGRVAEKRATLSPEVSVHWLYPRAGLKDASRKLPLCPPDCSSFQDEGPWGMEGGVAGVVGGSMGGGIQPLCLQKDTLSLLGPYVATRVKNGFFSHSAPLKACPVLETALIPSRRRHREKPFFLDRGQKGPREPEFNMDIGTLWLRKPVSALFIAQEQTGWISTIRRALLSLWRS